MAGSSVAGRIVMLFAASMLLIGGYHTLWSGEGIDLGTGEVSSPPPGENDDRPTRSDRGLNPAPRIKDLEYAVIGPNRFEDELSPLIEWKTRKGVRAEFFPLYGEDGVLESYNGTGKDVQEKIRDFLKALKIENMNLQWVLLAGDGEIIPPRDVFVNGSAMNGIDNPDNYVPTDYYYAGLDIFGDGDWDGNGNGVYGERINKQDEADWFADVYVGRFPASTEEEVGIMVGKQLSYEKDPPPGPWSGSMLLSGSLMEAPNDPVNYDSYKDNSYELVLRMEELLPDHVSSFHLVDYPNLEYGGYNQMFDTLNRSSFETYYRTGFSTVLIACHGDPYNGNCTNYRGDSGGKKSYIMDYEDHFTYDMADTIENGEKLPMVYISSCASTRFFETDDTNMERLLRNPNGGAIGLIGATVKTYRGEFRPDPDDPNSSDSYGNWWLAQEFYTLLYGGNPRPGEALYKLKDNYQYHIWYELGKNSDIEEYLKIFHIDSLAYNLLGDPEGPIWLDEPRKLTISNLPETFDHEGEGFEFRITDASTTLGVSGAVVALTDPSDPDLFIKARTSSNGWIKLSPEVSSLSTLDIVITKEGYLPEERNIKAVSSWDIGISEDIVLKPEIPVLGREQKATFRIENPGSSDIREAFLSYRWYNMSTVQNITIGPIGNRSSINITVGISEWTRRGADTLTAWVNLPLVTMLENDTSNNRASISFQSNDPIEILGQAEIVLDEDKSFSEMYNRWLDPYTSSIIRIFDPDGFPGEPSLQVGALDENISVIWDDDNRYLDIIPERDWSGKGAILFTASDGSVTVSRKINITVITVPDPPRFIDHPRNVKVFEDMSFNFTVEVLDIDSGQVDLTCELDWINITRLGKNEGWIFNLNLTPSDSDISESIITLIARDDTNLSVELSLDLDVQPTNDPPRVLGPARLEGVTRGSRIEVDLEIDDIDGDTDFFIQGSFMGNMIRSPFTNFTLVIPEDAELGSHNIILNVSDGNGGYVEHIITVNIREKDKENFNIIVIVLLVIALLLLLAWGVFLRVQDRKQMRMLDSVGTNAPLEARPLTEKDFTSRRRKEDGIPMPPAPIEVEGALVRGKLEPDPSDEDVSGEDMETDIDDILSEMFP